MNNQPRNASKTSNPDFWDKFYWGNGGWYAKSEVIYKNRDKFYNTFVGDKLFKCQSSYNLEYNHHNQGAEKHMAMSNEVSDHSEYYGVKNTKIRMILFHPYFISDENTEFVKANGFRELIPMYATGARSFMKIVDNVYKHGKPITEVTLRVRQDEIYDVSPLLLSSE